MTHSHPVSRFKAETDWAKSAEYSGRVRSRQKARSLFFFFPSCNRNFHGKTWSRASSNEVAGKLCFLGSVFASCTCPLTFSALLPYLCLAVSSSAAPSAPALHPCVLLLSTHSTAQAMRPPACPRALEIDLSKVDLPLLPGHVMLSASVCVV